MRVLAAILCLSTALGESTPAADTGPLAPEPVELRLWGIPPRGSSKPTWIAKRRVFDAFCRAHPEIRVRALVPLKVEGAAGESSEFLAVAGGVAPDVFYLYGRKVGDYDSQGFLYPLNDYLRRYAAKRGEPYAGIAAPSQVWELCHSRGRIVAVPIRYESMALACDKSIFGRGGLSGRYPRDWEEYYTFARHLTVDPGKEPNGDPADPVQYGISMPQGQSAGWYYLQYVWSAGGEVVQCYYPKGGQLHRVEPPPVDYRRFGIRLSDEDRYLRFMTGVREDLRKRGLPETYSAGDLEWRLETNGPEAMEALRFFRRIVHQPWLRNGDHEFDLTPEMLQARVATDPATGDRFDLDNPAVRKRIYHGVCATADLQSGASRFDNVRYAMQIRVLDEATQADPAQVAFVPFPSRQGFPPASCIAGDYVAINAAIQAENRPGRQNVERVREAAWLYIEFQTDPAAQRIMVDTFVEYGLTEFIRPAMLEAAGYADLLARIPPERLELWDNFANHAKLEPYAKGFSHVMTRELGMTLEAVGNDRPDPRTGAYSRDLQGLMDVVCQNVNTVIMGRMSDEEVRRRSLIGWVLFAGILAALALGVRLIVRLALAARARHRDNEGFGVGGHPARRRLYAWMFLVPAVISILIWSYYPLARGLVMAFQDFKILGGSHYVGLRNFIEVVNEPKFWRYLWQTLIYMSLLVGIGFGAPIVLAILLTEIPRGKVLLRTIYYLPAVTTGLVTLFLWKGLLYNPTSNGVLNRLMDCFNAFPSWLAALVRCATFLGVLLCGAGLLSQARRLCYSRRGRWLFAMAGLAVSLVPLGCLARALALDGIGGVLTSVVSPFRFETQSFLRDPDLVLLWLVVPVIWAGAGPGCLIYLAAMKCIPDEQYEAADLDGAGVWLKFTHVLFPNLKALIIINFIGAVIGGFKESGNIFVMTGGGPEDASMTTGLYIWYNAFMFLNFGLATAMAWIMGAMLIGFTLTQLRILNQLEFRAANSAEEKGR